MQWIYLIAVSGIFIPIPIYLYSIGGLRFRLGDFLGLLLFVATEVLWYSMVQGLDNSVSYNSQRVLSYQLFNLFAGDYLIIVLVYLNCISIFRWMKGD